MTRKRYIQLNGELVEVGLDYVPEPRADFHVMPDIKPYRSMIDGTLITSRSRHREHLRAHGCVEVGNDSRLGKLEPKRPTPPPGLKDHIVRATDKVLKRR